MRRGSNRELERGPELDVMEPWHAENIEAGPKSQYLMRGASPRNREETPEGATVMGDGEAGFDFDFRGWTKGDPPNPVPAGYKAQTKRAGPFNMFPYYKLVPVTGASAARPAGRRPGRVRPRKVARKVVRPAIPGIAPAVMEQRGPGPDDGEEDEREEDDSDELHGYVGPEASGILGDAFPRPISSESSAALSSPTLESRSPTIPTSPFGASSALASFMPRPSGGRTVAKGEVVGAGLLGTMGGIVVTTDRWDLFVRIDGTNRGTATPDRPLRTPASPGPHMIEAFLTDGTPVGRSSITVQPSRDTVVPMLNARLAASESGYWTDLTDTGTALHVPEWVEVGTMPEALSRIRAAARDFQALPTIGTGTGAPGDFRSLVYRGMTSGRYNRQRAWDLVRVYGEKWGRAMSALVFIDEIDDDEQLIDRAASEVRDRVNDCRNLVRSATGS